MGKNLPRIAAAALLLTVCLLAVRGRHFLHRMFTVHGTTLSSAPSILDRFDQHLVMLDKNGTLAPLDASALKNVKYFAFYLSASWCPPCRLFTPKLVDFYKSFKPQHPDFELIVVNHDASAQDMLAYMKDDAMPWPAVQYDAIDNTGLNSFDSDGYLPDLILVDAQGKVVSDSFQGADYAGPEKVLDDIKRIVP